MPWWSGLIGVFVGFALATALQWLDRRRSLAAYWRILREEVRYCKDGALGVRNGGVMSPLSRLPTQIFDEVFKHLVSQGDVNSAEARILMGFYDSVRQINASLDLTSAALERDDRPRAEREFGRMMLKTARFLDGHAENIFDPAIRLLDEHCNRPWYRY